MDLSKKINGELNSPFLELEIPNITVARFIIYTVVWMVFWLLVGIGVIYLYAVLFAAWVGFETALLVGIGIIALGNNVE